MQEYCIKTSSNMFWIFVRIDCLSNKYQKHMFYEEIIIKQDLSHTSFFPLRILYNRKFILMATSLGTNAVVVTRVYYILYGPSHAKTCRRTYAESKGPDQPMHLHSLIRASTVC